MSVWSAKKKEERQKDNTRKHTHIYTHEETSLKSTECSSSLHDKDGLLTADCGYVCRQATEYHPRPETVRLLDCAMATIRFVPYKVSPRWVFYRVMQQGLVSKREIDKFDRALARARKHFWKGWRPDTLIDSVRECYWRGEFELYFHLELNSVCEQNNYAVVMFEARAMHQQFRFYTEPYRVPLVPFGGDCSIPIKWEIAKKLESIHQKYQKPVNILYFGDLDFKGVQIYRSALNDILEWCSSPVTVERVGLTPEQAKAFNLPENPQRPGQFQWEALSDEQAASLIVPALEKYVRKMSPRLQITEQDLRARCFAAIQNILAEGTQSSGEP